VLVAVVLLQPGKTDAGALFTSNISSAAFGPRGTASVLSKVTIAAATFFMLSALLISMPAFSGNVSVLQHNAAETTTEAPATTEPADTNGAANTTNEAAPAAPSEAPASNSNAETPAANK
jgi:preprotein translocase subunit SecG